MASCGHEWGGSYQKFKTKVISNTEKSGAFVSRVHIHFKFGLKPPNYVLLICMC